MDEQRYEQRYEQWAAPLRSRPGVVRALRVLNRGIVGVFYAAYAVLLGWACATDPWKLAPLSGVVALGFAAVSAYRSCLNAPRPYERCAISPLIVRDGAGESFPSRHAFSAFAIAASWFAAAAPVALALLAVAALLAVCRVLGRFSGDASLKVLLEVFASDLGMATARRPRVAKIDAESW